MTGNAARTLTATIKTVEKLGAVLPKATATDYAKVNDVAAKVQQLDLHADLPGVVLAAIEAGNDPITDPAVQREATRLRISDTQTGLDNALAQRAQAFLDTHAAAILAALRKPFDTAAQAIAETRATLGDLALDNLQAILAKGGNAASLWAQAKQGEQTIRTIQQTWGTIANTAMTVRHDPQYRLLIIADVPRLPGSTMACAGPA